MARMTTSAVCGTRWSHDLAHPDAKNRNHVYYRLNEVTEEVEIVLVWNAVAGATPDL